jgi:hypothetical protein
MYYTIKIVKYKVNFKKNLRETPLVDMPFETAD